MTAVISLPARFENNRCCVLLFRCFARHFRIHFVLLSANLSQDICLELDDLVHVQLLAFSHGAMPPLQRRLPLSLLIFRLRGPNIRKLGASVLDLFELLAKVLCLARFALDGAVAIDAAEQKKAKDSAANPD